MMSSFEGRAFTSGDPCVSIVHGLLKYRKVYHDFFYFIYIYIYCKTIFDERRSFTKACYTTIIITIIIQKIIMRT